MVMQRPYRFPGPYFRSRSVPPLDRCGCTWFAMNDDPWRLHILDRACPHHGWVETPVGALGVCLAFAGRINVPVPMHEPIRRLRYSLRWQADAPNVRAALADVRMLIIWLSNIWAPWQLFAPLDALNLLLDWRAWPCTREEEDALRQYD
ncbi:hypothetical protein [Actinomadura litoris]|uniref:hypothetical protein n=1 Tax=Actinomadura litoris TaxID=2678616 RepID=UPI001FA75DFC|nr:hypothetical protein [Actinomadura litoris]